MTQLERLMKESIDGLKAQVAAEFWEEAHDRVKDRMLELECEVDSLRHRLTELGAECDHYEAILERLRRPTAAVSQAAASSFNVHESLQRALTAAEYEATHDPR